MHELLERTFNIKCFESFPMYAYLRAVHPGREFLKSNVQEKPQEVEKVRTGHIPDFTISLLPARWTGVLEFAWSPAEGNDFQHSSYSY